MENRVFAVAIRQEVFYMQGRRKVWKSGGASSDGVGNGHNLHLQVEIGLTDLQKYGRAMAPPGTTGLIWG